MDVVLETERLILRQFTIDDVDNLVELDSDPDVTLYVPGGSTTTRDEVEAQVLPAFLSYYQRYGGYGFWPWWRSRPGTFSASSTSGPAKAIRRTSPNLATACGNRPGARDTPPKARSR